MMVNYSKQNVLAERRIEGLSGGLSMYPRPRLAVIPDLRGPDGLTSELALITVLKKMVRKLRFLSYPG